MQAVTDGVLWVMERSTFRTIVLAARMQMRQRYEEVLADMAIFQDLTPANRSSIADCLIAEVYQVSMYSNPQLLDRGRVNRLASKGCCRAPRQLGQPRRVPGRIDH
jgi:hypothetical protein